MITWWKFRNRYVGNITYKTRIVYKLGWYELAISSEEFPGELLVSIFKLLVGHLCFPIHVLQLETKHSLQQSLAFRQKTVDFGGVILLLNILMARPRLWNLYHCNLFMSFPWHCSHHWKDVLRVNLTQCGSVMFFSPITTWRTLSTNPLEFASVDLLIINGSKKDSVLLCNHTIK